MRGKLADFASRIRATGPKTHSRLETNTRTHHIAGADDSTQQVVVTGRVNEFQPVFGPKSDILFDRQPRPRGVSRSTPRHAAVPLG